MYKVVISGETKLWILHYCNHASTSGYCTFSSCPISQQKGKSKRARLMLSCTMSGLVVEQYSLLILLLIETKQKTEKEGCTGCSGLVNKHSRFKLETVHAGCCLHAESDRFEQPRQIPERSRWPNL
ncbi:hypothetical protein GmHk_03G008563 [Glycine max]|nr:hypothetical protein GmHk_03G008563 [Glycine max]